MDVTNNKHNEILRRSNSKCRSWPTQLTGSYFLKLSKTITGMALQEGFFFRSKNVAKFFQCCQNLHSLLNVSVLRQFINLDIPLNLTDVEIIVFIQKNSTFHHTAKSFKKIFSDAITGRSGRNIRVLKKSR